MDSQTASSTACRILDAAERLFGEHGHDNTSMRQITRAAGTNLSAVNYHFGSKDGLIQAVFQRRLAALNKERLSLLDALEGAAQGQALKPSQIVEAFFGPLLRHACEAGPGNQRAFVPLLERSMSDRGGFIRAAIVDEHQPVLQRFRRALLYALPDVPEEEILWRFQFMLGATSYAITGIESLRLAMDRSIDQTAACEPDGQLHERLMSFLLGGLRAPLPGTQALAMQSPALAAGSWSTT